MLIPQFSIRWLLGLTTACAGFSAIVALAVRGSPWAIAVTVAGASLAGLMLLGALLFGMIWVYSVVALRRQGTRTTRVESPFAEAIDTGAAGQYRADDPAMGQAAEQ